MTTPVADQPAPVGRRRHVALRVALVAVGVLVLYFVVTALFARHELESARGEINKIKTALLTGNDAAARHGLAQVRSQSAHANGAMSGPIWAVAAHLPLVGTPFATARDIASTAHKLTTSALPKLVDAGVELSPSRLRVADDRLNLQPLAGAIPTLQAADAEAAAAQRQIASATDGTWFPPADGARHQFMKVLAQMRTSLNDAIAAANLMPSMLGENGPRNYLLVFETDAEARGLGGLPGAWAVVHADHGQLTFARFGNDDQINAALHSAVSVNLPADFSKRYDQFAARRVFFNSDMSPNYPYDATVWAAMYQRLTNQPIDGTIATDPTALSYLLAVTGPAQLADGTVVTAANVVPLMEAQVYSRFGFRQVAQRKAFFASAAKVIADHIIHSTQGKTGPLAKAMGRAVGERRLLVWSAHPDEEARLASLPIGGVLPETKSPFVALAVNNATGGKLDFYLARTLDYSPGSCHGNVMDSKVTLTFRNAAPASGLPRIVTIRSDHPSGHVPPGSERILSSIYVTQGARLLSATMDGKPVQPFVDVERGHPVLTVDVEMAPSQIRTLVFRLAEPRPPSGASLQTIEDPMVWPMTEKLRQPSC